MPQKLKNFYHLLAAIFSSVFFGFPARKLIVIGVTGTDGKTTTVNLVYEILKTAGKNVSMISSIGAKIRGKDYDLPFHVTTPSSWQLQGFLRKIANEGYEDGEGFMGSEEKYLVLEVTSHALDQNRVWGIPFKIAVLTNITHEHLDYHKTYEEYVKAKVKLFRGAEWAILNKEDKSFNNFKFEILNLKLTKILTYGLQNGDITLSKFSFHTPLPGEYNKLNCLAAIGVGKALGIGDKIICEGIGRFEGCEGRFEFLNTNRDFRVLIDFAHTPNAMEKILSTIRPMVSGKLIHIFGAAGLRDKSKRPMMGEIAGKYDDIIVLTEEDYRTEDVDKIMSEIEIGIKSKIKNQNAKLQCKIQNLFKISDRQQAINKAISLAEKDDLILLTGKGHEKSLCRGKIEYPWSEHEAVKKALNQYDFFKKIF